MDIDRVNAIEEAPFGSWNAGAFRDHYAKLSWSMDLNYSLARYGRIRPVATCKARSTSHINADLG